MAGQQEHSLICNNILSSASSSFYGGGGIAIGQGDSSIKTTPSIVKNNFIHLTGKKSTGLSAGPGAYCYNNSIYVQHPDTQYRAVFLIQYGKDSLLFVNNILFNDSAVQPLYILGNVQSDYNDIYSPKSSFSLTAWQKKHHTDLHSFSVNPDFIDLSAANLHLKQLPSVINGSGLFVAEASTDIDGQPRPLHPDIGADQLMYPNLVMDSILSPADGACGDSAVQVLVRIRNTGNLPADTFYIPAGIKGSTAAIGLYVSKGSLQPVLILSSAFHLRLL